MRGTQRDFIDLSENIFGYFETVCDANPANRQAWMIASERRFQNDSFSNLVSLASDLYGFWFETAPDRFRSEREAITTVVQSMVHYYIACRARDYPEVLDDAPNKDIRDMEQWLGWGDNICKDMDDFYSPSSRNNSGWGSQRNTGGRHPAAGPTHISNGGWNDNDFSARGRQGGRRDGGVGNWLPNNRGRDDGRRQMTTRQPRTGNSPLFSGKVPNEHPSTTPKSGNRRRIIQQPSQSQPQSTPQQTNQHRSAENLRANWDEVDRRNSEPQQAAWTPRGRRDLASSRNASKPDLRDQPKEDMDDIARRYMEENHPGEHYVETNDPGEFDTGDVFGNLGIVERIGSNVDLVYTKSDDKPFTMEDWKTKPDPDFPWELAYRPATHIRRIAYDRKRKCFVQLLEVRTVKYEDHAMLKTSKAIRRPNAATRPARNLTPAEDMKIINVPEVIQRREEIITARVLNATPGWEKQKEEALKQSEELGTAYVDPEPNPSVETVKATPIDGESEADISIAEGVVKDGLVHYGTLPYVCMNEEHANYLVKASTNVNGITLQSTLGAELKYYEATPCYLLGDDERNANIKNALAPLSLKHKSASPLGIAMHLKNIATVIPSSLWNLINDQCTAYVNSILNIELGIPATLDSFADDFEDLPNYISQTYGKDRLERLNENLSNFTSPLKAVFATVLDNTMFSSLMENTHANWNDDTRDRTILVGRFNTMTTLNQTSPDLNLYSESDTFSVTEEASPELFEILTAIKARTARENDGEYYHGYFRQILWLADAKYTIHESWITTETNYILKRIQ